MRSSLLLVIALAACGSPAKPAPAPVAPPPTPPPPTAPAAEGVPVVEDAGAEPRVLLRFHAPPGTRRDVTSEMVNELHVDGELVGTMTMTNVGTSEVVSLEENGDYAVRTTFSRYTATGTGVLEANAQAIEQGLKSSENVPWTKRYRANGELVESSSGKQVSAEDGDAAPLPTVPVGRGARWTTWSWFPAAGTRLEKVSRFEVVDIDGDRVSIRATITAGTGGTGYADETYDLATYTIERRFGIDLTTEANGQAIRSRVTVHVVIR